MVLLSLRNTFDGHCAQTVWKNDGTGKRWWPPRFDLAYSCHLLEDKVGQANRTPTSQWQFNNIDNIVLNVNDLFKKWQSRMLYTYSYFLQQIAYFCTFSKFLLPVIARTMMFLNACACAYLSTFNRIKLRSLMITRSGTSNVCKYNFRYLKGIAWPLHFNMYLTRFFQFFFFVFELTIGFTILIL